MPGPPARPVPPPRKVSEVRSGCGAQASMPKVTHSPPATSLRTQPYKMALPPSTLSACSAPANRYTSHHPGTHEQQDWPRICTACEVGPRLRSRCVVPICGLGSDCTDVTDSVHDVGDPVFVFCCCRTSYCKWSSLNSRSS